ncbi:MAG: bifunctional nuclease family protein [Thermomicrobiales bacterium]|nr:bifunctional nuclease family protein [Thermomicrobiales bacterium]
MIEATVESIRVSMVTQNRVVILREVNGTRSLPIWIGSYEAEAIALELQGVAPTRPLPYDLMCTMIGELGADMDRVIISDLSHKVYYATIVLVVGTSTIEIDARPSDALALAIRTDARILIEDAVMESAGITVLDENEVEQTESETLLTSDPQTPMPDIGDLGLFRDFINSLEADDHNRDFEL